MEKDSVKYVKYLFELVLLLIALGVVFGALAYIVYISPWSWRMLDRIYDIRFLIELGVFATLSVLILGLAVLTVYSRNIVHSALYLIGSFAGVAALYISLNAPFLGVAQVLVYIGAVGVLILFAVMLTRRTIMEESHG
ncbi:MAG TPA: NADH-quinone oxidoreductase subunit J [Methanothrix sp.]|nr:NADH-quinone oxidoreductase subunit J [Methanothrix sp.]HOK58273.1 NADH-quinone oxidoreductase subunit J [Methanothrix sp.]HOL43597.1 NADH-quinone oxidoreductase subunit J [Methanothrix sp.]HPO89072.1 NADH-quinone oxidoreductase subunit J [Methanothrix sp.]